MESRELLSKNMMFSRVILRCTYASILRKREWKGSILSVDMYMGPVIWAKKQVSLKEV